MSVATAAQLNRDRLMAALPAGTTLFVNGDIDLNVALLASTASKTLTATGATDAQIQSAVTTAAGQFADYAANRATLLSQARTALGNNAIYLAIGAPTNPQVVAQVQALTRQVNGLIRFAVNDLTGTT